MEATKGVTGVVEDMHRTIGSGPAVLGSPLEGPMRVLTELIYGGIRGVATVVGASIDVALAQLAPLLGESTPGPERDAIQAVLNGVLGDHLADTSNPLAIDMRLRREGQPLDIDHPEALRAAIPDANGKLLVMVHGSCMTDRQWLRGGHDHGQALARDLGFSPVYLHYNSGQHISTNGDSFATLLEKLVDNWPVAVDQLVIVAHSMGGLVTRSACYRAELDRLRWRDKVRAIAFLGTPHHGAPLERGGNWIDVLLGVSRYSAPLARVGQIRSAGVTDLRFGTLLQEDWVGRDRFDLVQDERSPLPLPEGVSCFALAGTLRSSATGPPDGDGLVPLQSALGLHRDAAMSLRFVEERCHTVVGAGHLDLLESAEVYATLHRWLAGL